jgi:hypothetical protein
MKLTISLSGTEAMRANLARLGAVLSANALAATAVDVEQYVENQAAKHHQTGALFRSVFKAKTPKGWDIGHDTQAAPHAVFVVDGTKPHIIRPKRAGGKKTLRWAGGGVFAFAKQVHHPGYKGDDYIGRAAALAPAMFERHVLDRLQRL